jgi:hypothetical protein
VAVELDGGAVTVPKARRRTRLVGGRERRFYVKASGEEAERLEALATAAGVSVPRLLVEAALTGGSRAAASSPAAEPRAHPAVVAELLTVGRLLGRIGTNVNQIARATNATREAQPETAAAMEAVERVAGRMDAVLDELRPTRRGSAG